jgi:hypothetical protein
MKLWASEVGQPVASVPGVHPLRPQQVGTSDFIVPVHSLSVYLFTYIYVYIFYPHCSFHLYWCVCLYRLIS